MNLYGSRLIVLHSTLFNFMKFTEFFAKKETLIDSSALDWEWFYI